METNPATDEIDILAHYLIGHHANPTVRWLYANAVADRQCPVGDRQLLDFALAHPRWLGLLDGGLAFLRPGAELRRRLYLALSLLETVPEDAGLFLPKAYSFLSPGPLIVAGIRGICRTLTGILVIKLMRFYK